MRFFYYICLIFILSSCFKPKAASCTDNKQNQDETEVDCGGNTCAPCPTCADGKMNGDETGVDCGGKCGECPTCEDGKKNGTETGIDCGGNICNIVCNPSIGPHSAVVSANINSNYQP